MPGPHQPLCIDDLTESLQQPPRQVIPSSQQMRLEMLCYPSKATQEIRLSQAMTSSLLMTKNLSITSQGKLRQSEMLPKEGWKASERSFNLAITNILSQTCPSVAGQGSLRKMHGVASRQEWPEQPVSTECQPRSPHAQEPRHGSFFWVSSKWLCAKLSMEHSSAHLATNPGKRAAKTSKIPVIIANHTHTQQYLCTKCYAKYVPHMDSLNPFSNPLRKVLLLAS